MSKCPVCGEIFSPAPFHIYKISKNSSTRFVCSWHCMRAWEKKVEEKKKQKKEARKNAAG